MGSEVKFGDSRLPGRFWAKVRVSESDCWLWQGCVDRAGYGVTSKTGGTSKYVHRRVWQLTVGPIPPKLTLDHLCRVRNCCNPGHLEVVTHAVNVGRGTQGQWGRSKTHCPQGHEYTPANTIVRKDNGCRKCRECNRIDCLERFRRKRAERVVL